MFSVIFYAVCDFMKLFRTGSVDMVTECEKMFNFLPLKYHVDIRTASFMLRFISSENTICHLFVSHAALTLNNIYTVIMVAQLIASIR